MVVASLLAALVYSSFFFVDETEYVYVTTFGKPVRLCIEPGLQLKWPYQTVYRLDRRLQMANPPGSQMLTGHRPRAEQPGVVAAIDRQGTSLGGPPLTIEWYCCWRLPTLQFVAARLIDRPDKEVNPPSDAEIRRVLDTQRERVRSELENYTLRFVRSVVGSTAVAQDRLRERIDSLLEARVGRMSLSQFVNLDPKEIQLDALTGELTREIGLMALEEYGIEIVDLRIKRFNHPEGVRPAIFEMIRTERHGVAEKYRAEGKSEATKIKSRADTERAQILSKAYADAERIRGDGDAEAMQIASAAHAEDPQFYQFLKTLDTYRAILNEKTTIVLSSDSALLKLLTDGMPNLPNPSKPSQAGSPDGKPRTAGGSSGNGNPEKQP
jgi:membrane protease subunit HflC